MLKVGIKDRIRSFRNVLSSIQLSFLESVMLDTILQAFVCGIAEEEVRHRMLQYMMSPDQLLSRIYITAEKARRAKLEL